MGRSSRRDEGATLLEFAIVLPVALMLLLGIAEGARFISSQQAVTTASREAARYGSTTGENSGVPHYADCAAIRGRAKAATPYEIVDTEIAITYDEGPATSQVAVCGTTGPLSDPDAIETGNRIVVTITKPFSSSLPFIDDVFDLEISATEHRTIVKGEL